MRKEKGEREDQKGGKEGEMDRKKERREGGRDGQKKGKKIGRKRCKERHGRRVMCDRDREREGRLCVVWERETEGSLSTLPPHHFDQPLHFTEL